MSRSSDSGQVEPLAALVAAAAVCLGLSLYAGLVVEVLPGSGDADAEQVLDTVHDRLAPNGVVRPDRLAASTTSPAGLRVNVTLDTSSTRRTVGPSPPAGASTAGRHVSVRRSPARIHAGRLRVVVW